MPSVKIVDGKNDIEIEISDLHGADVDYLIQRAISIADRRLNTLRWGPEIHEVTDVTP